MLMIIYFIFKLCNYITWTTLGHVHVQSPSPETNSRLASQKILRLYRTRGLITELTTARHRALQILSQTNPLHTLLPQDLF
jgi:hypothetical protein